MKRPLTLLDARDRGQLRWGDWLVEIVVIHVCWSVHDLTGIVVAVGNAEVVFQSPCLHQVDQGYSGIIPYL